MKRFSPAKPPTLQYYLLDTVTYIESLTDFEELPDAWIAGEQNDKLYSHSLLKLKQVQAKRLKGNSRE